MVAWSIVSIIILSYFGTLFYLAAPLLLPPVDLVTPLSASQFAAELRNHPDHSLVAFVIEGITHGFRLGFSPSQQLKSATHNKQSALQHGRVIDNYLALEVKHRRVAGPFPYPPLPHLHTSSFGVIPKRGQPGKWRLIVDLSSPHGSSINDGIDPKDCTLQYVKLDTLIRMIAKHGPGALMAKFDVECAYRNIPIHPNDRALLGMKWRDKYYVDLTLPFGLRSAPYIFNSVATLVEWILINNYSISDLEHYLDDFILVGPPSSSSCAQDLALALIVCKRLGLPLHPDKCEGPSTSLTILGIRLDTNNQTASLPENKFAATKALIESWVDRRTCNRQQLESLIGHLHHAAKVVWPGRSFIRRMIDLLCCFRNKFHPIRLNKEFRLDLLWWHNHFAQWHGVQFWLFPGLCPPTDIEVTSDAAGAVGFGAFFGNNWFNGKWLELQRNLSIAYKELYPIVVAADIWGADWHKRHIRFRSDNEAVVAMLNSRTSKVPNLMHLIRHLLSCAARHNFSFSALHIPGVNNSIADALSRFHWQEFHRLAPQANPVPSTIPHSLVSTLVSPLYSPDTENSSSRA